MTDRLTYAVGDIHGSYDKVAGLIRHCTAHCGENELRFVFLGDYVDRGSRSKDVVDLLMQLQAAAPERVVCLKGNHEEMLVSAAHFTDTQVWLDNGGDATLESYGVACAADIPGDHLKWLARLPPSHADAKRFYVHAGIVPGVPFHEQRKEVMLWVRGRFLNDQRDHGLYVVHGHTPTDNGRPQLRRNRLCLDTFAWHGNPLFAAVFNDAHARPVAFIDDSGGITAVPETPAAGYRQSNSPGLRRG